MATRVQKYDFAISQSISGSFKTNDTVEASFLSKANTTTANGYITQFVDLKYSVSSESISLQEFPKGTFPEQFFIGNSYTTQSFTAGIPEDIQYVEFLLTGSLDGTGSNLYNSGSNNYNDNLKLDYDQFQLKIHQPKTELTDSGLLVFTSPNKFIKANSDGVEIKGGNIEAEKVTTQQLEVFGDTTIFGDITATANTPYDSTPNEVSTTGAAGNVSTFARGDHTHDLSFSTLNTIAQEGEFTNLSGSKQSTGSFGKLEVHTGGTADHTLIVEDVDTGIGHPNIRSTGTLFLQQGTSGTTQVGGDFVPTNTRTKNLGSTGREFQEAYIVSSSVSQSIVNGNLDVGGNISGSNLHNTNTGDVTLSGTPNYITISGQTITRNKLDISDDTNLIGGTGITLTTNTLTTTDSEIVHDDLSGFETNEHIDHSSVSITAGAGLNGGGTIASTRTLSVDSASMGGFYSSSMNNFTTLGTGSFGIISASGVISGSAIYAGKLHGADITTELAEKVIDNISAGDITNVKLQHSTTEIAGQSIALGTAISADTIIGQISDDTISGDKVEGGTIASTTITNLTATHITASSITASGTIFASAFSSQGSDGDIDFSDSLDIVGNITASGNISASGILNTKQLVFNEPFTSSPSTIKFNDINTLSSSKTSGLMWDFRNDDVFIYAHQSSSDQTRLVFESSDNLSDGMIFWFNDYRGPDHDGFPLFMQGDKFVVNNPVDRRAVYHKDQNHISSSWNGGKAGPANNVDFYLLKSGSTAVSIANSLIHGDVSAGKTTLNDIVFVDGHITASGNISSSGTGTFNKLEIHNDSPLLDLKDTGDDDDHKIRFLDNSANVDYQIDTTSDILNIRAVANNPMAFFTNNTERVRILDGGNVGIGTTAPTKELQVEGSISSSEAMFMTNNKSIQWPYQGVNSSIRAESGHLKYTTSHGDHIFRSGSTDLVIFDASTEKVGIGTSSPARHLHISSSAVTRVAIDGATGNNARLHFNNGGVDTWNIGNNASDSTFNIYDSVNGKTPFRVYQGTANNTLVVNDGSVGIGTTSPSEKLDVDGNIKAGGNISSPTFFSGFAGNGFRVTSGSKYSLEVDDLTIRGTMSVYELLIHQIRATNGSLFVSNTGKITSASFQGGSEADYGKRYDLFFDTGSGYGHSFQTGDIVRAQRFVPSTNGSGSQVFKSDLHIFSVEGTGSAIGVLTGSHPPQPGYEYVRIGNINNPDRQGSIYLTADDDNAPFIDVVDTISSHSHFNTSERVKTRLGKLDGITTSTRFGTLSGYGFYASGSAFLEGSINATSGSIGDFIIDNTEIRDTGNLLRLKSGGQITASRAIINGNSKIAGWNVTDSSLSKGSVTIASTDETIRLGAVTDFANDGTDKGIFMGKDGSDYEFFVGQEKTQFIHFDGNQLRISSSNFSLENGNITASNVDLSGKITATSGQFSGDIEATHINTDSGSIGGFTISPTSISASNGILKLKSNGQITASAVSMSGTITADSGQIGGFTIDTHSLSSTGVEINNDTQGIFISSSKFQVDHIGNITASNVALSGSLFSTDANISGILSASQGNIGGFTLDTSEIKSNNASGDTGLRLKANGEITASAAKITGDIVANTITANTSGQIGGFGISATTISSSTGTLILRNNGQITASAVSMSGNINASGGTIGGFTIGDDLDASSGTLKLKGASGQLTASAIKASGGKIGGWSIISDDLSAGQGDEYIQLVPDTPKIRLGAKGTIADSNTGVHIGSDGLALGANSVFKVTHEGVLTATSATITGAITATSGVFSGSISASAGTIGKFNIDSKLSSGTDIVLDPISGGRITLNNKSDALSSTKGIYIGSSSINNVADEYVIALGDTSTNDGGLFAIAGPSSDYVYIGEFGQANSSNNDITQMSGSFISYKSSNQSIAISSKHFKLDETGDIQISSSGDSAQILLDVDANKQQGIEINSDKGIFGYGDKDGDNKKLETHGGMFKFTAVPVSIDGGLGGQGWPTDDTSDAPPTTHGGSDDGTEIEPGGGYSGT